MLTVLLTPFLHRTPIAYARIVPVDTEASPVRRSPPTDGRPSVTTVTYAGVWAGTGAHPTPEPAPERVHRPQTRREALSTRLAAIESRYPAGWDAE